MPILVQFDFPYSGPFGQEMAAAYRELAVSISQEPGLLWKIWTENPDTREAGGIYLFVDEPSAEAYVRKHTSRMSGFGVKEVRAKTFSVNLDLSAVTKAPL